MNHIARCPWLQVTIETEIFVLLSCLALGHFYGGDRLNGELWNGELSWRVMILESYVWTISKPRPLSLMTTPNFLTLSMFSWTNTRELYLTQLCFANYHEDVGELSFFLLLSVFTILAIKRVVPVLEKCCSF